MLHAGRRLADTQEGVKGTSGRHSAGGRVAGTALGAGAGEPSLQADNDGQGDNDGQAD